MEDPTPKPIKRQLIRGVIVGLVWFIGLGFILPPTKCNDGFQPPANDTTVCQSHRGTSKHLAGLQSWGAVIGGLLAVGGGAIRFSPLRRPEDNEPTSKT